MQNKRVNKQTTFLSYDGKQRKLNDYNVSYITDDEDDVFEQRG